MVCGRSSLPFHVMKNTDNNSVARRFWKIEFDIEDLVFFYFFYFVRRHSHRFRLDANQCWNSDQIWRLQAWCQSLDQWVKLAAVRLNWMVVMVATVASDWQFHLPLALVLVLVRLTVEVFEFLQPLEVEVLVVVFSSTASRRSLFAEGRIRHTPQSHLYPMVISAPKFSCTKWLSVLKKSKWLRNIAHLSHFIVCGQSFDFRISLTTIAEPGGNSKNRFLRCNIRWKRMPFGSFTVWLLCMPLAQFFLFTPSTDWIENNSTKITNSKIIIFNVCADRIIINMLNFRQLEFNETGNKRTELVWISDVLRAQTPVSVMLFNIEHTKWESAAASNNFHGRVHQRVYFISTFLWFQYHRTHSSFIYIAAISVLRLPKCSATPSRFIPNKFSANKYIDWKISGHVQ